jgi:hypothetical protein
MFPLLPRIPHRATERRVGNDEIEPLGVPRREVVPSLGQLAPRLALGLTRS